MNSERGQSFFTSRGIKHLLLNITHLLLVSCCGFGDRVFASFYQQHISWDYMYYFPQCVQADKINSLIIERKNRRLPKSNLQQQIVKIESCILLAIGVKSVGKLLSQEMKINQDFLNKMSSNWQQICWGIGKLQIISRLCIYQRL